MKTTKTQKPVPSKTMTLALSADELAAMVGRFAQLTPQAQRCYANLVKVTPTAAEQGGVQ